MALNNTVILTGNMGSEARLLKSDAAQFAALSLATMDCYKDDHGQWHAKDSIWHNLLVFNPKLVQEVKNLKKGTRIKITGSLSYQAFDILTEEGDTMAKKEASVIVDRIELAPLIKKNAA